MKPLPFILACVSLLFLFDSSYILVNATVGIKCDLSKLFSCAQNETCVEVSNGTGRCDCLPNFVVKGGVCIPKSPDSHTSTTTSTTVKPASTTVIPHSERGRAVGVVTGLLIVCVLVVPLGGALFYFGRRHKWLDRLHKLTIRNYNTVLVSSANDDDAPIT